MNDALATRADGKRLSDRQDLPRLASGRYVIYDELYEHDGLSPFTNWQEAHSLYVDYVITPLMGTSPLLTLARREKLRSRMRAMPYYDPET